MKKVSIILIDWNVRESFHAIDYLNRQTIPRSNYEIIWVEYYDHRPKPIQNYVAHGNIDKWIVLNRTEMYFKHLLYNEGIIASTGGIIVICDSDAIFPPTFIESIITTFNEHKNEEIVLYLEEVRSNNKHFYPFKYIPWEDIWIEVIGTHSLINWDVATKKPSSLNTTHDILHYRNYGACFCATRKSIIEGGGFDEHYSYHNIFCGPYELGFRLVNKDYKEIWHQSEWILHVWHPWARSGVDILGENYGGINSTALEIRKTGRIIPLVENEKIFNLRTGGDVPAKSQSRKLNTMPNKLIGSKKIRLKDRLYKSKFLVKCLLSSVKINKVLNVTERDYGEDEGLLVNWITKFGGLIGRIETFNYDTLYHKLGQKEMSELLVKECKRFKPDLVVFVPLRDTADLNVIKEVEPTKESISRIVNEVGIKVYICCFDSIKYPRADEWLPVVNYAGFMDKYLEFYEHASNSKVICAYPTVNPIEFYDKNIKRDIDVCFWGSIPVNSGREEYIRLLRDNGINVYTRLHRVSVEKYAEILNRSKISLSIGDRDKKKSRLRIRAFEIMACNSLLMEESNPGTDKLFEGDKDFVVFRSKEELLEKVRYYLQHEEERKLIAQSGCDKVTNIYNSSNMWGDIFKNMGFNDKNMGIYPKIACFCFESFELIIKQITRKILPSKFRTLIKSIASRLHIDLAD